MLVPLTLIINQSLETDIFLNSLKLAKVKTMMHHVLITIDQSHCY